MIRILRDRFLMGILSIALILGFSIVACEGPAGSEGPRGPEGAEGPVGPAGENGSVMYADQGEPDGSIGDIGDYYLNQNTGELFGPKSEEGWGESIIVMMGEDGQDGEDGSQIHSGEGAPEASLGVAGDYYLDKSSYELYGPKTSNGWGVPLNLKGADGNANVTRYIWGNEVSFSTANSDKYFMLMDVEDEAEMQSSVWLAYLGKEIERDFRPGIETSFTYYSIPGYGQNSDSWYQEFHYYDPTRAIVQVEIHLEDGPGEVYDQIEIIRIEANNTGEMKKQRGSIIPDHLDTSNYQEVAEYFDFYK